MEELYPSGLRDWAAIRAHLKRHDAAMVKDYEDDINTMLVFVRCLLALARTEWRRADFLYVTYPSAGWSVFRGRDRFHHLVSKLASARQRPNISSTTRANILATRGRHSRRVSHRPWCG